MTTNWRNYGEIPLIETEVDIIEQIQRLTLQ